MKTLITLLLFLSSLFLYGQTLVGVSYTNIQDIVKEYENEYKLLNGEPSLVLYLEDADVLYLFDEDMICYSTVVIPNNHASLQNLIKEYNEEFVIISTTEWLFYELKSDRVHRCHLVTGDEKRFFVWLLDE